MEFGIFFTKILAIATLLGNALTVILLFAHVGAKDIFVRVMQVLSKHVLRFGFLISFAATFGSIFYSQVMGYPACILCWTQRIFMYPLVFLFGLALWRQDRSIIPYALFLSVIGGGVALYEWVKDMLALYTHFALACPVVPGLPSCDRIYIDEFGYITIPMLALNAFILIGITCYAAVRGRYDNEVK
jgi:disulfide bond formation protein DsbB